MPANEQTWRDTKLMHVVFGVSSIVMLITTVWMMADDHNRPWKDIQRTFRDLDVRSTQWRATEQQSADYESKTRELERQRDAAQEAFTIADRDRVIELFDKFKEGEEAYVKLAKDSGREASSLYEKETATSLKNAAKALGEEKDPKKVRADRADLIKRLNKLVDPLESKIYFRENNLTADVTSVRPSPVSSRRSAGTSLPKNSPRFRKTLTMPRPRSIKRPRSCRRPWTSESSLKRSSSKSRPKKTRFKSCWPTSGRR